ncbi:MAG TPA: glucose-1-phosphate thymidylyltransferase RfbA [Kofleriaceae bacterium]|nr:glucose-1-phosphate thymidylyltransferase RfbA [Kofleriaceae bacterium]
MKGILLAGGSGTRLYPLTTIVSKQLQPVFDKPMIYYPLTSLILAGLRDILIITTEVDSPIFQRLLGDGTQWGLRIEYAAQARPRGIAEALLIGEAFVGDSACFLMLGDNLIYGRLDFLRTAIADLRDDATIFAYEVADPSASGVVEFDDRGRAITLEEKPAVPRSSWAVPGIYLYPGGAAGRARRLAPSPRGELEITDLNRSYLADGRLRVVPMGRGIAWLDTGTAQGLLEASNFVETLQARQGLLIGSPDEAAMRAGFISPAQLARRLATLPDCPYRSHLARVVRDPVALMEVA